MAADGFPVTDELLARLSSLQDDHITLKVREAGRVEVAEGQPGVGGPSPSTRSVDAGANCRVGPQVVMPVTRLEKTHRGPFPGQSRGRCRSGDHGLSGSRRSGESA